MQKLIPFYTPIWGFKTEVELAASIDKCVYMQSQNGGACKSNRGGWQSTPFNEEEFKQEFKDLYPFIKSCISEISLDTKTEYKLKGFWVNVNKKHDYNVAHIHSNSAISGCIYLQVDMDSGKIVFRNPTPSVHYQLPNNIEGFYESFKVTPQNGTLVMFPSYLDHYVEENNSDLTRISIAFNCDVI